MQRDRNFSSVATKGAESTAPEALAAASADLSGIGEAIKETTTAAVPSTIGIVPPAADQVSAAIARLFGIYSQAELQHKRP